jgi:hypothetical protein
MICCFSSNARGLRAWVSKGGCTVLLHDVPKLLQLRCIAAFTTQPLHRKESARARAR